VAILSLEHRPLAAKGGGYAGVLSGAAPLIVEAFAPFLLLRLIGGFEVAVAAGALEGARQRGTGTVTHGGETAMWAVQRHRAPTSRLAVRRSFRYREVAREAGARWVTGATLARRRREELEQVMAPGTRPDAPRPAWSLVAEEGRCSPGRGRAVDEQGYSPRSRRRSASARSTAVSVSRTRS
jgi:hypothetical protein